MQIYMTKDYRFTPDGASDETLLPKGGTFEVSKATAVLAVLAGATNTKSALQAAKKTKAKKPSAAAQKNSGALAAAGKKIEQLEGQLVDAKSAITAMEKDREGELSSRNNLIDGLAKVTEERNTAIEVAETLATRAEKLEKQVEKLTAELKAATAAKTDQSKSGK